MSDISLGEFCEPRAGSAELALRRWGFTGDRLLRLAARVARDQRSIPEGYLEDAIGHLTVVGIQAALEFDPARAPAFTYGTVDKHFEAFAYYRMRLRLIDWLRSTSNGNGFGRNGTLGREQLGVEDEDDLTGWEQVVLDRAERDRWKMCAHQSGLTVAEWLKRAGTIQADFQTAA